MVAVADKPQVETWRNRTAGKVVIRRLDGRGNLIEEIVAGHKTISLTPEERRLNQDRSATPEMDHFSNGIMSPVRLIDGEEDVEQIHSNPNLLADSDLVTMFKSKGENFADKLGGISNPITLNRLLEMAYERDATVGQVEAIRARLDSVDPAVADVTVGGAGEVRTAAPEGRQRPDRGGGLTPETGMRPVSPS